MTARAQGSLAAVVPIAPKRRFYQRLRRSGLFSASLVLGSLAIGTIGYKVLQPVGWIAAFHKAALILSGMGPVDPFMDSDAGKIFEALYAIYSGVILLAATAVFVAPIFHRLMHRFHLEDSRE
ncbi:MAG TPA: hypothetical protein VFC24_01910 [Casimicrobiaceae bacterium]|nr:hypothetical protein [Casimicrobiaceae bacterium]